MYARAVAEILLKTARALPEDEEEDEEDETPEYKRKRFLRSRIAGAKAGYWM